MNLPLIGYVGKPEYSVSGISNNAGFELIIRSNKTKSEIKFETKNYSDFQNIEAFREEFLKGQRGEYLIRIISFLAATGLLLLNFPEFDFKNFYWDCIKLIFQILIMPLVYFLAIYYVISCAEIFRKIISRKDMREWHACEHKSVILIESGLAPTVENLKSCPTVLINCGTTAIGVILQFLLTPILIPTILRRLPIEIGIIAAGVGIIILISTSFYLLTVKIRITKATLIIPILALPALVLPLLIQKFCALQKPSDEKLAQTASELKLFVYAIPAFFQNQP